MTDSALEALRIIGAELHASMLAEARSTPPSLLAVAVLVLTTREGKRAVTYLPEYGDGEGIAGMNEMRAEILEDEQLENGESLEVVVKHYPLEESS